MAAIDGALRTLMSLPPCSLSISPFLLTSRAPLGLVDWVYDMNWFGGRLFRNLVDSSRTSGKGIDCRYPINDVS